MTTPPIDESSPTAPRPGADPSGAAAGPAEGVEREWWQEPGLPWQHKPTRSDIACLSWMGVASVYGLILLPLRPVMLGLAPHLLGSLGYRTGLVMTGALGSLGDPWWPLVMVLGSLMAMKFDWIYWWAGKLWGHGLIEVWSGRSERARRRNERAISFAHKYESLAIFVTYLPIPMPSAVVYAALGAAGTGLKKFLALGFASSLFSSAIYLYLGWTIGEPAVELINQYGQFLWYVSLAIIVGMIAVAWWKSRHPSADEPKLPGPAI